LIADLSPAQGADSGVTETTTRLVDDLDGGTAERTAWLSWDGHSYEIDLSKTWCFLSSRDLRYRRVDQACRSAKDARLVRANGYEVSDRGRIAGSVVEAYEAAQ
jgi:hypothetical protein